MYINTFRLLAFIILFAIIIIVEIPFKKLFKDPTIQLYIAVFCIAILMLLDNITGFILTIAILILYFRVYTDEIKMKRERENMQDINDNKPEKPATATADAAATTATTAKKEPGHKEDTHKPNMDSSKEAEKGAVGTGGAGCDKGCDKCSMEMPKKKNIFNEMAVDNFVPYITEENLLAAQTNIIDVYNYNLCINNDDIETLDVKRGPLCDIQGLQDIPDLGDSKRLRGYDTYHSRLGNLTYDIL
jgi:Ca2+/Na+ antiporter